MVFLYSAVKIPLQYFWIIDDFPTAPFPTITTWKGRERGISECTRKAEEFFNIFQKKIGVLHNTKVDILLKKSDHFAFQVFGYMTPTKKLVFVEALCRGVRRKGLCGELGL